MGSSPSSPLSAAFRCLLQRRLNAAVVGALVAWSCFSTPLHSQDSASPELPDSPVEAQAMLMWENKDGQSLEATFEGLDGEEYVFLKPVNGLVYRYPIDQLTRDSQWLARNKGKPRGTSFLFLGDSMSLGGFGETLDKKLRGRRGVEKVNTYMACGTNPLSWLKARPYANIKTHCGYWSIESVEGSKEPKQEIDVYGMRRGYKPGAHTVPKLENLLVSETPEVLILQCGNNLFSAFRDGKTIKPGYHLELIRAHVVPFVHMLKTTPSSLKKVYWVTPPQAGNVTDEIQAFVCDQIRLHAEPWIMVIDSRKVTSFPYKQMGPDKEHFWGGEADNWAERVYELIHQDLTSKPLIALQTLQERHSALAKAEQAAEEKTPAIPDGVKVRARLLAKTPCPEPEKFAPYREFMVGYKYSVESVVEGQYHDKEILVMHPMYIHLKKQAIEQEEVGALYELHVRKLDVTSLWNVIRRDDASDSYELEPYLLVKDELRHPDAGVAGSKTQVSMSISSPP